MAERDFSLMFMEARLAFLRLTGAAALVWGGLAADGEAQSVRDIPPDLIESASAGDLTAQLDLGRRYLSQALLLEDYEEAVRWFRMAAEQGHPEAQMYLGFLYMHGDGVPTDYDLALHWLRLSAEQGQVSAYVYIADASANGWGVPYDPVGAANMMLWALSESSFIARQWLIDNEAQALKPEVRQEIQRQLRGLGLYQGEIDGVFGPQTLAALRQHAGPIVPIPRRRGDKDVFDPPAIPEPATTSPAPAEPPISEPVPDVPLREEDDVPDEPNLDEVATLLDTCLLLAELDPIQNPFAFTPDEAAALIGNILGVHGQPRTFKIVATYQTDNAAAAILKEPGTIEIGERYIIYNPNWVAQTISNNEWEVIGLLAHEIGHHVLGHTLTCTGSNHQAEIEADGFAGRTMFWLGASVEEAQSLWWTMPDVESDTHPRRSVRLEAVAQGWRAAEAMGQDRRPPAFAP